MYLYMYILYKYIYIHTIQYSIINPSTPPRSCKSRARWPVDSEALLEKNTPERVHQELEALTMVLVWFYRDNHGIILDIGGEYPLVMTNIINHQPVQNVIHFNHLRTEFSSELFEVSFKSRT